MGGRSGHHNNLQKIGLDHSSTVSFLSDMFLDVEKKLYCHNQYCIVVITITEDKGQIHSRILSLPKRLLSLTVLSVIGACIILQ